MWVKDISCSGNRRSRMTVDVLESRSARPQQARHARAPTSARAVASSSCSAATCNFTQLLHGADARLKGVGGVHTTGSDVRPFAMLRGSVMEALGPLGLMLLRGRLLAVRVRARDATAYLSCP